MVSQNENSDLKNRLRFLGLDDRGRETLRRLGPLIHNNIGDALAIFYDKIRKVPTGNASMHQNVPLEPVVIEKAECL